VTPEQIDSKQSLLASIVTDDAASAMFDALKRKHAKKPDALAKAIDELLTAHDIDPNAEPPASRASGAGERPNAEPPAEPPPPAAETTHEPTPQPAHASGAAEYVVGGFARVPNVFVDQLLAVASAPLLRAYVVCCRLADRGGAFRIAHLTLAKKVYDANAPRKDESARRSGERIMSRLVDAGLVVQLSEGGPGRTNTYRLASLVTLDTERARRLLAAPLTKKRDTGRSDRSVPAAPTGMYRPQRPELTGHSDRSIQSRDVQKDVSYTTTHEGDGGLMPPRPSNDGDVEAATRGADAPCDASHVDTAPTSLLTTTTALAGRAAALAGVESEAANV